jgi:hypothetical protein
MKHKNISPYISTYNELVQSFYIHSVEFRNHEHQIKEKREKNKK